MVISLRNFKLLIGNSKGKRHMRMYMHGTTLSFHRALIIECMNFIITSTS